MNSAQPSASLLVAVMIACVATCYGFGIALFSQIIPDMRQDLGFGYAYVGAVTGLIQLSSVAFALTGTWLVHCIGAARTVVASVALCGLCLTSVPLTGNLYLVAILLMIAGGTGASTFVPMIDLAARVVSTEQRGFAMSLISSAPAYGVLANSALVPAFAANGHWQMVWYVTGAAAIALSIAAHILFGRAGLFGNATSHETPTSSAGGSVSLRSTMPWVALIFALGFTNGMMPYPYLTYLSPFLREELGYSVGFASWLWAIIGAVGIGAGFIVGGISSRLGSRYAMLFCYLVFLAAGVLMVLDPSRELSILAGILFSLGFYPIYGLLPAYVSHRAVSSVAVTIFGICTVLQGIGGTTGNFLGGVIKTSTGSFSGIYLAVAIISAIAVAMTIALPKDRRIQDA
ncbi:nitrate/nitrite transporter [Rhizobium sp. TH2]|uniref:MFS transporter n=1 Tax=Rhizobium sp. TH2 TaxID=2775403 RepID=UPI002157E61C|nr:MFS transporter [Rhizobium sp. TH2]